MARYFIELQYDGTAYFGWQRQPDAATVQGTIEDKLSMLLRVPTEIVGAGRTDTGVNASFYTAHFDSDKDVDCTQLCYKLNKVLPVDIAIMRIYEVKPTLHARFDAIEREYTYFLSPHKSPFRRYSAWHFTADIDVDRMNEAAKKLLEYEDFTSFAKLNSNNKTNICHISHAEWIAESDGTLRFTIRANRFLRNMVRAIVGTMVYASYGKIEPEDIPALLEKGDRRLTGPTMPPQGLYMNRIWYEGEVGEMMQR